MLKISLQQLSIIFKNNLELDFNLLDKACENIELVSTDSRKNCCNSLFFALNGENFDGHNYLEQAIKNGASALVINQDFYRNNIDLIEKQFKIPFFAVKDTFLAIGELARYVRNNANPKLKVIAITGSSGKTGVKEMTASILSQGYNTIWTQANLNNTLGVPLTLLNITEQTEFAVIEMGANHPNEIAQSRYFADPDVVVVNNLAPAHLEGFGGFAGLKKAKGEIFADLKPSAKKLINLTSNAKEVWNSDLDEDYYSFADDSLKDKADFYATATDFDENSARFIFNARSFSLSAKIEMNFTGTHNILNAVCACSLALLAGADAKYLAQGLRALAPIKGRLYPQKFANLTLIDDCYNANLASFNSALEVLSLQSGYKILVCGDMKELGESSQDCHQQLSDAVAKFLSANKLDKVYSLGEFSQIITQQNNGLHFMDKRSLTDSLISEIKQKVTQSEKVCVLIKGSRSMQLDLVVEKIKEVFVC